MEDLPSTCGDSSMGAMMINHGIWGGFFLDFQDFGRFEG
jgi:hypothetical protein